MDKLITEKLIEFVKIHPELYNIQDPQYRNHKLKTQLWKNISKEIDEPSDILRIKWKGLKDGYIKYKKWMLYKHAGTKSFQNWCWAEHLEFLAPYIQLRVDRLRNTRDLNTSDSVSNDNSLGDNLDQSPEENEYILDIEDTNDKEVKLEPRSDANSSSTSRPQSPILIQGPIETTENHNNTDVLDFIETKRLKRIDDVDLLFMSYADSFRKFSVGTRAKLKMKLASLFAVAELQEHNLDNSVILP